jgi:hypothetical protein
MTATNTVIVARALDAGNTANTVVIVNAKNARHCIYAGQTGDSSDPNLLQVS